MLNTKEVKEYALECGADVCGIGKIERYEGAPIQFDPRQIMPEAKSIVVLGFRVFRGLLRGIEEGTAFEEYASMGYCAQNHIRMPMALWNFGKIFEDNGYEAFLVPNDQLWSAYHVHGGFMKKNWSRPVAPGKAAPDVWINHRIAAYIAGLGEIGWSQMFLSPVFGPRARYCCLITEAELDPDPLMEPGTLCDKCMCCVRECSGNAISKTESVKVNIAGKQLEWGKLDLRKCLAGLSGRTIPEDQLGKSFEEGWPDESKWTKNETNPFITQPPGVPFKGYGNAIEGARGCMRACMIHLEQQGKLSNKFNMPFRRRKPWKLEVQEPAAEQSKDIETHH